ncbi:MAG: hypothetical protein HDS00_03420 [Bacteroides sp.]|nr:hypothetical protein [Bacteroides sp.]
MTHNTTVRMRILAAIFLPLAMFLLPSCSDENDLPDVDIDVTYTGATTVDGTLYVDQTQPFAISSVVATAVREGHKAGVTNVAYGLDGWVLGVSSNPPFAIEFDTSTLQTGRHLLTLTMTIAEEGCELATAYYATTIQVVASPEEIPSTDDTQGTFHAHPTIQAQ